MPDMSPRHLRVIDLSRDVAGGFCAKLLAMNGAEVVRVGDDLRGALGTYLHLHTSRSSASPRDLVPDADVVITTFDAGRYVSSLDEAGVRALNPSIVHVTTSSFGTTGPYSPMAGGSLVDWAAGGYLYITGEPDREPLAGPLTLCGYVAGYTAAIAAMAGVLWGGRVLDVSVMESMLSVHQSTFSRLGAGILRTRTGRFTEVYPLVVLPCRTGSISLGVVTDEEFDRLTIAMDRPALAGDPRFSSQSARQQHVAELEGILVEWFSHLEAAEAVDLLQAHAVAAATVASAEELLANPQLEHRSFWDRVDGRRLPGNPLRAAAPSTAAGAADPGGPVAEPVVLDLTAFWAGPSATRNLADLGARVIRVERPGTRVDFVEDGDTAAHVARLFDYKMNRGKESVVLDLKAPGGRDAFLRLAQRADVLVENYRAGVMSSLGLGWDVLHEANPRLVYVALSGFGAGGPWSRWRSYGPTIEAASSIEDRTRYPGTAPLRLGHTLPDGIGGLAGTLAALVGLRRREEQGCGSYFDLSQLEAYCVLSGEELLAGAPDTRSFGVYPCRGEDEWVAAAVPPDPSVARSTARRTKRAAARHFRSRGIEAFPVLNALDLVADPQLEHRGYFVTVPDADGTVRLPGTPFHGDPPLAHPGGRPPRPGEHTATVLTSLAGLTGDELARLRSAGAVIEAPAPSP